MSPSGVWQFLPVERPHILLALILLFLDGVFFGLFCCSILACPTWLVMMLVESAVRRPGWGHALFRVALPVLTFGLIWFNYSYQLRVAEAHAPQIIAACDRYHDDYGEYPQRLDELVPDYLPSIPVAKYDLSPWSQFHYYNNGSASLYWHVIPPYGRKIFNFEERRWSYLD